MDLLEKEEELKTVRKKVEELEAMNQKMQSKVDVASSSSVALLEKEEELKTVRKKVEELEAMNQKMRSKVKQRDLDNEEKETKYEKLLVEHEALKKQLSQVKTVAIVLVCASCLCCSTDANLFFCLA